MEEVDEAEAAVKEAEERKKRRNTQYYQFYDSGIKRKQAVKHRIVVLSASAD